MDFFRKITAKAEPEPDGPVTVWVEPVEHEPVEPEPESFVFDQESVNPLPAPRPDPEPVVEAEIRQAQPSEGGGRSGYRIVGVWLPDGSVSKINNVYVELEGHDQPYTNRDLIPLNRREAAVLSKRYALSLQVD